MVDTHMINFLKQARNAELRNKNNV